jgi:DNA (cytosine-5)-methyltransferase 3A
MREVPHKYFLMENVASMSNENKLEITRILSNFNSANNTTPFPILINAALVSAQNRKRLFWTNATGIGQPTDQGILLKNILEENVDEKYLIRNVNLIEKGSTTNRTNIKFVGGVRNKDWAKDGKNFSRNFGQGDRVYSPEGKSTTLSAEGGGRGAKTGLYAVTVASRKRGDSKQIEIGGEKANSMTTVQTDSMVCYAPNGKEIILGEQSLQVLKEGRTEEGKKSRREIRKLTGKDSTLRSKDHKAYFGREGIKANCITTGINAENLVVKDFVIRKLTPVECERLQSLPDNYTDGGISNSQRYKCCGNAFNKEVVKHIFRFMDFS